MTDGRKHQPARATLAVALTLGLTGAGVVAAAPASAAPDDLDSRAQEAAAEVERLAAPAEARRARHDQARQQLSTSRDRVERIQGRIAEARRLGTTMRSQMAQQVMTPASGTVGASAPGVAAATDVDPAMAEESTQLLANVLVVTEDSDGRAQEMTDAMVTVERLVERRVTVRAAIREQRQVVERTARKAERAEGALATARGRAADLEAELQAEREAAEAAEREAEAAEQAESTASSAVDYAMAQVGKSYVWGATGPDSFDCSGLTTAAWATQGVSLPRTSSAQYASGTPVSESELQPGDLVFYYSPISHVGIYVGNGQVVNALNPSSGVQVTGLHDMPYSGAVRPG